MSELEPARPIDTITSRWPGLASRDIDQSADFVSYCATSDLHGLLNELYEADIQDATQELVRELARNTSWRFSYINPSEGLSRDECLQVAASTVYSLEQSDVREAVESGDEDTAETAVATFLAKWPFEIQVNYDPSPLLPEGRQLHIPIDLATDQRIEAPGPSKLVADCYGSKEPLHEDIVEYIKKPKAAEETNDRDAIRELAESYAVLDPEYHQSLRETYGTKAANLFVFAEALTAFQEAAHEKHDVSAINVPKFTAAPVALYEMYKRGDTRYEDYLEQIRQQAVAISADRYDPELFRPLVAIKSSAVYSEDGENASGAGIYTTTIADPRDQEAFRSAVEEVFGSLESEQAKNYLADKGIENELMGLAIQQYIEGVHEYSKEYTYGFIQSDDGSDRVMELSTNLGVMVYDRGKVADTLMQEAPWNRKQTVWHFVPEHDSGLAQKFNKIGTDVANAALFAEKLFGRAVELEVVLDTDRRQADIVQVRPIPNFQQRVPEMVFPTDIEPIAECRALGVGDVIVTIRDDDEYEQNEVQVDWISTEDREGARAWSRDEDKVLMVGYNDGFSGHIQMLARERGQICLFPESQTRLPAEVWRYFEYSGRENGVRRLRIVSDGYKGAIYPVEYNPEEEVARAALLQRVANTALAHVQELQSTETEVS